MKTLHVCVSECGCVQYVLTEMSVNMFCLCMSDDSPQQKQAVNNNCHVRLSLSVPLDIVKHDQYLEKQRKQLWPQIIIFNNNLNNYFFEPNPQKYSNI